MVDRINPIKIMFAVRARFIRYLFLIPIVAGLVGVSLSSLSQTDQRFIEGIARAYDGDGVYVDGIKIRLWGIDAPELRTAEGDASFASLASFVDGQWVKCNPPSGNANFPKSGNRKVALCTMQGVDLAWFQVNAGHAHDWPYFSKGYYRQ